MLRNIVKIYKKLKIFFDYLVHINEHVLVKIQTIT